MKESCSRQFLTLITFKNLLLRFPLEFAGQKQATAYSKETDAVKSKR